MEKQKTKSNLLAVRIEPWQLFKFKKFVEWRRSRPSIVIQEALEMYFYDFAIPKKIVSAWLEEYQKGKSA
jgi:hypothetical protein